MLKKTAIAILFVFTFCIISSAQEDKGKRPSPPAQAQCKFSGGNTITVNYSSPRMRGRKVFGELVPYGKVWRTGANEATTFVTDENLNTVEGTNIPAGSYTIFTVPNPDAWTLIINKHTKSGVFPTSMNLRNWPACLCPLPDFPHLSKTLRFHSIPPAEAAPCA